MFPKKRQKSSKNLHKNTGNPRLSAQTQNSECPIK